MEVTGIAESLSGFFADVYTAIWGKQKVAAKQLKDPKQMEAFEKEVAVHL